MAWDKNQPVGSVVANQLDDLIRTNNEGLETAVNAEHYFVTGGTQTGRHKFGVGTEATRNGTSGLAVAGAVWILTGGDIPTGQCEVSVYDGTAAAWRKSGGRMLLELNSNWTKAQFGDWVTISPSGTEYTPDFSLSNFFKFTPNANFTLKNPTSKPAANKGASYIFEITQGSGGSKAITFDTDYVFGSGIDSVLSTAAGAIDYLYGLLRSDGKIHMSLEADSKD